MKFKKLAAAVCAAALSLTVMSVTAFAADGIPVDAEHFPDENFRAYVSENCDTDKNGILSDKEIAAADEIHCAERWIKDLKGIEYFTALEKLYCHNNQLTELDVSKNTALERLYCGDNRLTELDISNDQNLIIAYRNGHSDDFFHDVEGVFNRTIVIGIDDETGSIIEYTILADEDTKIITDSPQAESSPADDDGKIPADAVAGIAAGAAAVVIAAGAGIVVAKKKKQS